MASRTGESSGGNVVGLRDFRAELARLDKAWPKELRAAHKKIADIARDGSRQLAVGWGGVQAHSAGAIRAYADQTSARVGIQESSRYPAAAVAFWGAKKRTGWYAARRYSGGARQHDPWVGNSWDVATFTGGPYVINRALFFDLDSILDTYLDMLTEISRLAFPD